MRLPNAENAWVDQSKLSDYLLSEAHPVGRSKARLFRGIGFHEENGATLEQALLEIARTEEVREVRARWLCGGAVWERDQTANRVDR